ncbi:hypothetical protein [uncultured Ferrimonas sp.]|uniref:hypothetical protein n=1 Tax=uncultured Ferrimonas sp. TaxID=432640 RepID=UPI002633BEB5|nr:hypothetical protein [uncultured Ferrimonas sp.]
METVVSAGVQAVHGTPTIHGDKVVNGVFALLLCLAVTCFMAGCFYLNAYMPSIHEHGISYETLRGTSMLVMFLVSAVVALPTTVLLLLRCIWSASEVSFYAWTVVLTGGVLSYIYIVFGMNMFSRYLANSLSQLFG